MNNGMNNIVLSELDAGDINFLPGAQTQNALLEIRDTYQTTLLAKIPFAEIAMLGGAFSTIPDALMTPAAEGLYRCVFPEGITGTLALAKDGSGALGTIMNKSGIAAQARWVPAEKAIAPAVWKCALVAVAVLAVAKQIGDIKDGQKEIAEILDRDKKSQLLADFDILTGYMEDYRYYWENEADVIVNLNQVKNIKRNAQKDVRSYREQLEDMVNAKSNPLKMQSASRKIGDLLNRFVHYKLALNVFAMSDYMEVMISKNFHSEYLDKVSEELRDYSLQYKELYTDCYEKIEKLKTEAIASQAVNRISSAVKSVGETIGKIPVVKNGRVDEFLAEMSDIISEKEANQLRKTLNFFIQYKDSGISPVAEHIDAVNSISNAPTMLLCDNNVISFAKLQQAG